MKPNAQTLLRSLSTLLLVGSANLYAAEICVTSESDPDGDGYGWEQEATCLVVGSNEPSNTSQDPAAGNASPAELASRSIVNPRTGESVNVERIYWQTEDFAGKSFSGCVGYVVDPAQQTDQCLSCGSGENFDYQHYADGNGRLIYSYGNVSFEAEFEWGVDTYGLYYGPMPIKAYAEVTETGVNQWLEGKRGAIGFYEYCEGVVPSVRQGPAEQVSDEERSARK